MAFSFNVFLRNAMRSSIEQSLMIGGRSNRRYALNKPRNAASLGREVK
jgi:hypothetical protein